ncbi:hypothetical protein V7S43_014052 [Phytophthora oleae]|uniref:Uncharacterized protein n=1 Tax=Phytophthora oleae TaxID=2107226 RepID=A0ABD3F3R3_9STRA
MRQVADLCANLESVFDQCQTASARNGTVKNWARPPTEAISWQLALYDRLYRSSNMQGIFTLALLLLNSWLGTGVEAVDAAHATRPIFVGGGVVVNNCKDCTSGPTIHTLLKHSDNEDN